MEERDEDEREVRSPVLAKVLARIALLRKSLLLDLAVVNTVPHLCGYAENRLEPLNVCTGAPYAC